MSTTTDQTYEAAVIKAACERAETHVLDVLCALEASLKQLRFNIRPWHDGKVKSCDAIQQANSLKRRILDVMPLVIEFDFEGIVRACDDQRVFSKKEQERIIKKICERRRCELSSLISQAIAEVKP